MPEVRLAGIEIRIPVLGFGCSSLASVGRKKALLLLESAFDVGIRHFDVARYYGYGETEGILGTFVKSRSAQVTITTKFGIEPPRRTNALRIALGVGRRFLRLVPSARKVVQRRASVLVKGNAFSVADARRRRAFGNSGQNTSISICCTTTSLETILPMSWLLFCGRLLEQVRFATSVSEQASTV
jgi:hypothetical protein